MKNVKKGAFTVIAGMAGGAAGQYVMAKVVPATMNEWVKMGAPAGGAMIIQIMMKKSTPVVDAFSAGMAGSSGAAIIQAKVINGIGASDEEILLNAFSEVNGTESEDFELLDSMNAAANFDGAVAAAANFDGAVAGSMYNATY